MPIINQKNWNRYDKFNTRKRDNMPHIYKVIICNVLPPKKQTFACRCDALKFIKQELTGAPRGLARSDVLCSIRMYSINEDIIPEHSKYFA